MKISVIKNGVLCDAEENGIMPYKTVNEEIKCNKCGKVQNVDVDYYKNEMLNTSNLADTIFFKCYYCGGNKK